MAFPVMLSGHRVVPVVAVCAGCDDGTGKLVQTVCSTGKSPKPYCVGCWQPWKHLLTAAERGDAPFPQSSTPPAPLPPAPPPPIHPPPASLLASARTEQPPAPAPLPPAPPPPTPAWDPPTSGTTAGIAALSTGPEECLPLHILRLACLPCGTPLKCGVKDHYCENCSSLFRACADFLWEYYYDHGLSKSKCRQALTPVWGVVEQRLRSCSLPTELIVPCPKPGEKWGATMRKGLFVAFADDGHMKRHGLVDDLQNSRLVCVNGIPTHSLADVTGSQATLTVLVPRHSDLQLPATEPRDFVLEEGAASAWSQHEKVFAARCKARFAKAKQLRLEHEQPALEIAQKLFQEYKVPTADGGWVPFWAYRAVCLESSDEDDCIRRLYAWAEKHDSSASDATEDDDEEQETPLTTTTTTTATSTTADHQVVDEEKKRWKRRFAK
jgi:hypothetical protein